MTKLTARKLLALLMALCLSVTLCLGGLTASAAEKTTKMVTITTNSDINPFIRVALHADTFKSGGPFTVHCEMNISEYQRTKSDANVFVNITDGRGEAEGQLNVWLNTWHSKTDGWVDMVDYDGNPITFDNISVVLISGMFEKFALLQFGSYYAKGTISYRNFYITNAAGDVVYSWDTDPYWQNIEGNNLKNFAGNTAFALTFGDGSASYIVSDVPVDSEETPEISSSIDTPDYEDEEEEPASKPAEETSKKPAEETSKKPETSSKPAEEESSVSEGDGEYEDESQDTASDPTNEDESQTTDTSTPADDASTPAEDTSKPDADQDTDAPADSDEDDDKEGNPLTWALIVVAALLLAAVGVIVWLVLKNKKPAEEVVEEETAE